jgi:sugar O-acyltransferase (sialic acid O-acetyltransferase NeuD family)
LKAKKNILIIGASGHAKVIIDILEKENLYNVFGFIDTYKPKGKSIYGYEILGTEKDIPKIMFENDIYGGIIAIGDNWVRKIVSDKVIELNNEFKFITTIHPDAIIGNDVQIGEGVVIMPGVIINSKAVIGKHCILNTKSFLGCCSKIYDYSSLGPSSLVDYDVVVKNNSAISLGVNIVNNIIIGENSVIGAGSLVLKNIANNKIAFGIPAIEIRDRFVGEKYLSGEGSVNN